MKMYSYDNIVIDGKFVFYRVDNKQFFICTAGSNDQETLEKAKSIIDVMNRNKTIRVYSDVKSYK